MISDAMVPFSPEALRPSRADALLRAVEGSHDAFWDWDLVTGRLQLDRSWFDLRALGGESLDSITEANWKASIHEDDLARVLALLRDHLSGSSQHFEVEYRVRSSRGSIRWILDRGSIVARGADGLPTRLAGLSTDIAARKGLEARLYRAHTLVNAVQRVQSRFIIDKSIKASATAMLAAALEVTGCTYGFIGEVLRDENGDTYLQMHALTDISWIEEAGDDERMHHASRLQFRNHDSLFGYTLRTGLPLITNTPQSYRTRSGVPGGHPPMDSFAGIPVQSNGKLVGMIGLANRPGGFDESIIPKLEPLSMTFSVMVEAQRADRERANSERAIIAASQRSAEDRVRLRNVTNGIPGAVCQWLSREGDFLRLLFISDGVRALTGLEPEAAQQSPRVLLRALAPRQRRVLRQTFAHHARCATPWTLEFSLITTMDSEATWIRLAAQPRMLQGGLVEWNAVLVDISETKGMESQLIAAKEQADAASRAKGSFLAAMSHEIRTPIHAMLGYLELLQRSPLQNTQQQQLSIVSEATKSLLSLLDDILDFSRIEAGKMQICFESTDPEALLSRNHGVWAVAAARSGLRLNIESNLPRDVRVMIDPVRTQQILINLMSNALKFTREGSVTVAAQWQPGIAPLQDELRFTITDTGIGIPLAIQQRIFEPFEQEDAETTRRYGGSGLGLAICRRLAQLLGGRLDLESEPGYGTCVRLVIPAARAAVSVAPGPVAGTATRVLQRSLSILVVEDSETSRNLLTCQLEELGVSSTALSDGLSALSEWQRGHFDLILTDCHMPGIDGLELARSVRAFEKSRALKRIPIIAITADAFPETEQACLAAGMDDYLAKPVGLAALRSLVSRWSRVDKDAPEKPDAREASTPPRAATIDHAMLDRVTGGIPWLRAKALTLFLKNLAPELERLDAALKQADAAQLGACSHSLTGAARTIGAAALSDATAALMERARDGIDEQTFRMVERIRGAAAMTRTAVEELLRAN